MTLADFPQLQKLPKRQRFQLADALWLSGIDDAAPVSPAHKHLLDTRWQSYRAGQTKRITLAELERRLARP
jgi:putative addiction module component (TIGR02574 family)